MAIEIIGGRPRSVRTEEEIVKDMVDSLEAMSPDEQAAFIHYLDKLEQGQNDVLDEFINVEYVEEPVSPRTFLLDEYYLGAVGSNMWPKLQDDFVELFEGGYSEAILTGSLGWGKCGTENSYFVDGESGRRFKISQAVGLTPLVPSLDGRNKVSHRRSSKVWKSGQKRCSKMTLVSGHWLEVSLDHPVLCPNGYKPIGELSKGDFVAVARRVPAPLSPLKVTDDEVIVAAALIADGGMTERTITSYTKGNVVLRDEIVKRAHSIQGFSAWRKDKRKPSVFLSGLQDWTEKLGIRCLSKDKRVPGEYFGLCDEQLSLFLRWLFTDGNVHTGSPRKIEITLASEGLIDDIQYLLRRFGVAARKSYRRKKNQDGEFDAWRLQIADAPNQLLFMEHVGFIPGKEEACGRLIKQARAVEKPNSNWDVVPITNGELKEIRKETGPHNNKRWSKLAAMADGSCMGAERFRRLCRLTGYQGRYKKFADMVDDIVWERVESVTDIGIHDVYDLSVPETQNAVINGIVVHNSFFATCGLAYILYQISCLAEPQRVYGLAKGTALAVAILSATREAARRVPLAELGSKLQLSPYFKEKCPYKIAQTMYEIRFPTKKIMVVAGSTSSAAIGTNVFSGFLDEMAFMGGRRQLDKTGRLVEVDKSEVLTKAIVRRMKSRFMKAGKLPGLMFLVSSKEKPVTFIEQKIEEARSGQSSDVFLRDYSTWSVKPVENFSGKTFQIAVGNETVRSKIRPSPEDIEWYKQSQLRIIDVPEEYFPDFDTDLEGALRDIAGIATESVSLFIHRREKIAEAIDETLKSPVDVEEWMSGDPLEFWWERVAIPYKRAIPGGFTEEAWRPIRHPGAVRYVHIDPSLSGDCAGLTILHIAGHTEVTRRDAGGESYEEVAPVIETDFMLKIIPPPGDEICLGYIRRIIYEFLSHGFQISYASMDSFQSADTRQQFKTRGIESDVLSVDKTTIPYESLKIALYENRLRLQDNVTIQRQLRALQRVQKTKGVIPKFMIDHPARGEKDLADSLAGGVHSLMTRQPGLPMAPLTSGRNSMTEVRDDSWVTGGKVMVPPSSGQRGGRQGMVGQKVSAKNMPMPFTRG